MHIQTALKFIIYELSRPNATNNVDIGGPYIENFVTSIKNLSEKNLKIQEIKMIGGHRILKKDLVFSYIFCLHFMNYRVNWELKSSGNHV